MSEKHEHRGKKRSKSYYVKSAYQKKRRINKLDVGMRGFLVTCSNNEKQAVRESYNILNEYADILFGPEEVKQKEENSEKQNNSSSEEDEDDIEKALAKEVRAIKETSAQERRFQNTDTSAKNCIFIRTILENPQDLAHKIFSDLANTKKQKTRYAMRMLPIAGSCKAFLGDITKLAEEVLTPHFCTPIGEGKSYAINFKVRNNHSIGRDSVLPTLGRLIQDMNPLNKVNLDNPDLVVLVEVICNVCCLGVVKDFYKFRKYNFHEVVKDPAGSNTQMKVAVLVTDTEESCQCLTNGPLNSRDSQSDASKEENQPNNSLVKGPESGSSQLNIAKNNDFSEQKKMACDEDDNSRGDNPKTQNQKSENESKDMKNSEKVEIGSSLENKTTCVEKN